MHCNHHYNMFAYIIMINTIHETLVDKYHNYAITLNSVANIHTANILQDLDFGTIIISGSSHKFYYFNGELDKISIEIVSDSKVNITVVAEAIPINQIHIAAHVKHFASDLFEAYPHLVPYTNDYLPVILYGVLYQEDFEILKRNKSLKIIIWTGGDMCVGPKSIPIISETRAFKHMAVINTCTKVKHIAISNFIASSLAILGIPYIRVPFMGIKLDQYKSVIKGNSIYIYTSPFNKKKYGEIFFSQLVEKYPHINFIFTCNAEAWESFQKSGLSNPYNIKYYDKKELIEKIYPSCFLALRLTPHDGLAGTVQEMGALGIKSIHNGDSPSCLNYKTLKDIRRHIKNESRAIGTRNTKLSTRVKNYLTIDKDFFSTNFFAEKLSA